MYLIRVIMVTGKCITMTSLIIMITATTPVARQAELNNNEPAVIPAHLFVLLSALTAV